LEGVLVNSDVSRILTVWIVGVTPRLLAKEWAAEKEGHTDLGGSLGVILLIRGGRDWNIGRGWKD